MVSGKWLDVDLRTDTKREWTTCSKFANMCRQHHTGPWGGIGGGGGLQSMVKIDT